MDQERKEGEGKNSVRVPNTRPPRHNEREKKKKQQIPGDASELGVPEEHG